MPSEKPSELLAKHGGFLALIASVVLYGITQHLFFALSALATIGYLVYQEFKHSGELSDLISSIAIALGAWIALSLLLNTTSPINIITSCSMLPSFERGDLILLQGADVQAPVIQLPFSLNDIQYVPAQVSSGGQVVAQITQPTVDGQALFTPNFGTCERKYLDSTRPSESQVCLRSIDIQGQTVSILQSPDVVVFDSATPAGLIIHRAFAILNATDGPYLLTKGDNNPVADQQSGFALIPYKTAGRVVLNVPFLGVAALNNEGLALLNEGQIPLKGKVFLRVPYIGYIKLLLFLQFQAPPGCESVLQKPAVA